MDGTIRELLRTLRLLNNMEKLKLLVEQGAGLEEVSG